MKTFHHSPKVNARPGMASAGRWPWLPTPFAFLYGLLLGLALLKFGNPIILDPLIDPPEDIWQVLFAPWPVRWGQAALLGLAIVGVAVARFGIPNPRWLVMVPLVWFGWQICASAQTIDARLTQITVVHFATCLLCFALGLLALQSQRRMILLCAGILPFFAWMAWTGFQQHYGGLDATERMIRETPNWEQVYPPEYLERIAKKRVFATLVYPNALAGAVLLLLPPLALSAWQVTARLRDVSRMVLVGLLVYAALACLVWSGSKSGWLIALTVVLLILLHRPWPTRLKVALIATVCMMGLFGFAFKFAPYFRQGATSVSARLSYWQAALSSALERPVLGTGPGTFARSYAKIRPAGAEMAQLVHNDYLEQASDSGVVGFLSYTGFWLGSMFWLYRRAAANRSGIEWAVWLGLAGWCLQSFSEFGLYIPALAWPAFTMVGWLWAHGAHAAEGNRIDRPGSVG